MHSIKNCSYMNPILVPSRWSIRLLFYSIQERNRIPHDIIQIFQEMSTHTWTSSEIKLVQNAGTAYLGHHFLATFIGQKNHSIQKLHKLVTTKNQQLTSAWLTTCILKQTQGWVCNQWQVQLQRSSVQSCTSL